MGSDWFIGHSAIHIVHDMAYFCYVIVLFRSMSSRGILFVDGQIFHLWLLYVIILNGSRHIFLNYVTEMNKHSVFVPIVDSIITKFVFVRALILALKLNVNFKKK